MKTNWKTRIIISNITSSLGSQLISLISLSFAVMLFALFSGFALSQGEILKDQLSLFPEFLTANLEKSEVLESESNLFKLKKVSRPSESELLSFLNKGIDATYHLNYQTLFTAEHFSIFEVGIVPFTPVFLESNQLNLEQKNLLTEKVTDNYDESHIFINEQMLKKLVETIEILDLSDLTLSYQLELEIDTKTYKIQLDFEIAGVFKELQYLSGPKIYFSQLYLDQLFQNIDVGSQTLFHYLENLSPSSPLSSYSYRLYFKDVAGLNRAIHISEILRSHDASLQIVSEHLSRVESLSDLFDFANIIMTISTVLIVMSLIFINVTITHLELKKSNSKIALLYYFGAKTKDVLSIYLGQNLILVCMAFSSLIFVPRLEMQINVIISELLYVQNLIQTPLLSYKGVPLLLPALIFSLVYMSSCLISVVNLVLKNQKSLINRLAHND